MIPEFLDRPGVLGIGEIGLNKNTRNEATVFLEHLELATQTDEQILIHTPHLEDKYQGTRMILDMLCDNSRINRERVLVDHVEEHTVRHVLDEGFWAGMTLYPVSKCTPGRAADIVEMYGPERLLVNSAGDWGPSKPTAVSDFILEMRRRGHAESLIRRVVYENPLTFFGQSRNFVFNPPDVAFFPDLAGGFSSIFPSEVAIVSSWNSASPISSGRPQSSKAAPVSEAKLRGRSGLTCC